MDKYNGWAVGDLLAERDRIYAHMKTISRIFTELSAEMGEVKQALRNLPGGEEEELHTQEK